MDTKSAGKPANAIAKAEPKAALQDIPKSNRNGPEHRFQLNQDLLYEYEFGGDTFVSAHLQRLQHGCFTDSNIHNEDTPHVTFVAITFTFHPSVSEEHRFKSAVIRMIAQSKGGGPIRFLKFAPHLAFGRISSTSLKWNFKLGATVGLSQGPAQAALKPEVGYEKDSVVGTMMKIQGSTRSTRRDEWKTLPAGHNLPTILPDTKLVWSLEENSQQESGLPREFTFVFLLERVRPSRSLSTSSSVTVTPARLQRSRTHSATTTSTEIISVDSVRNSTNADAIDIPVPLPASTKQQKHRMPFFHKTTTQSSPSAMAEAEEKGKGKEKEKGPYSDIGQSELSLELLDQSHGTEHSNQTLGGAGAVSVEAPKISALDIGDLPHEVLPGSDRSTFTVIGQVHSELSVRGDDTTPQEILSDSLDEQALVEHSEYSVQDSVAPETPRSLNEQTVMGPENTIPFPALDPDIIPTVVLPKDSNLDGAADKLRRMHLSPYEAEVSAYKHDVDPKIRALDNDYDLIFTPIRLDIVVEPRISGTLDNKLFGQARYASIIEGEVGQKFISEGEQDASVNGLYNFAKLPGSWEDLVELPGSAVTSVEPTLS